LNSLSAAIEQFRAVARDGSSDHDFRTAPHDFRTAGSDRGSREKSNGREIGLKRLQTAAFQL
jgi:hypothetical protein